MKTLAAFFEGINDLLGISGAGELLFHPVFIGICIAICIYSFVKGWKSIYLLIAGGIGSAVIYYYFYPKRSSDLVDLVQFIGIEGALVLVLVYLGFIRE
jgi:hypothetical protein